MLEHLAGDDDVEGHRTEARLDVPVQRLDPPLRSPLQRRCIDVHADDLVAREKMLRHGTRPTAQVEDTAPRTADGRDEQWDSLRHEDELALCAPVAMMRLVTAADAVELDMCRSYPRALETEPASRAAAGTPCTPAS